MRRLDFLIEGIKNIKTTGTFTRSSSYLCKTILKEIDFKKADVIVELGGGDGVITRHLLKKMKPDASLLTFEIHPPFLEILKTIEDPRLHIIQESAANIKEELDKRKITRVEYIVSGLPLVNFPENVALQIVKACKSVLKPGGRYIQFHYSLLARKLYKNVFGNVKVRIQLINFPPAFVLTSEKTGN